MCVSITSQRVILFQALQQSRLHQLSQDETQCYSYLTLASQTLATFHYLTKEITQPFLRPVNTNLFIKLVILVFYTGDGDSS